MSSTATEMVAVLMTDLVGSTAIADRVGPEVAEELRTEHFGLLRGALERSGGREVKNLGDGLMVVFDGAAQSLACAVQMRLARTRAGWARALIARGRPEDLDRAQHMLEQAEDTAERLGAGGITREVAECHAALAALSG